MKRFIIVFGFFFLFAVLCTKGIYAQSSSRALESCFNYYNYGKIKANINSERDIYAPGESISLTGSIINSNTFPLTDILLYAQIKRINSSSTFGQDGHYLVDQKVLVGDLFFIPGEIKPVHVNLNIPATYPNGAYQIQYFLLSKEAFHFGGRSFLEEDHAGTTNIQIKGGSDPVVYFDPAALFVKDEIHHARELITTYTEAKIPIRIALVDNRKVKSDIPVTITFYKFEDSFEEFAVQQETKVIPAGQQTVETLFSFPDPGAYVVVFKTETEVASYFRYRFVRTGEVASELRMNALGITNFPPTEKDNAYLCFHSPIDQKSPATVVKLMVEDEKHNLITEKSISGVFSGDISAISIPLRALKQSKDFYITGSFIRADRPQRNKTVTIHYSCDKFSQGISTFSLKYDSAKSSILVKSIDVCGNEIINGGYLDYLRVFQGDTLIQEAYTIAPIPTSIPLKIHTAGRYRVVAKYGKIVKYLDFSIDSSTVSLQRSNRVVPIILGALILVGGIVVYLVIKRRHT